MPTSGLIYKAPSRLKVVIYGLLRSVSAGFVAFAIIGLIFSFYPILQEEVSHVFRPKEPQSKFGDILSRIEAQEADGVRKEAKDLGLGSNFAIYIPQIDAKANIIANVDAGNKNEYLNALSRGVAHARGTSFPGMGESIYLFSHSTDSPLNFARYNAVFYLLGRLERGDRIRIYFLDQKFIYEVERKFITSASDISWLGSLHEGEILVLQTCYPPGTTLKRLIVLAKPI